MGDENNNNNNNNNGGGGEAGHAVKRATPAHKIIENNPYKKKRRVTASPSSSFVSTDTLIDKNGSSNNSSSSSSSSSNNGSGSRNKNKAKKAGTATPPKSSSDFLPKTLVSAPVKKSGRFEFENMRLSLVGFQHREELKDEDKASYVETRIQLKREPDNKYDKSAIAVHTTDERPKKLGFIPTGRAKILAPQIDDGTIAFSDGRISGFNGKETFYLRMNGTSAINPTDLPYIYLQRQTVSREEKREAAYIKRIEENDPKRSAMAPYRIENLGAPEKWSPCNPYFPSLAKGDSTRTNGCLSELTYSWEPFDPPQLRPFSHKERIEYAASSPAFPPSDDILMRFGFAPSSNTPWWAQYGLKPPTEWKVNGGLNLMNHVKLWKNHEKALREIQNKLDGAVHASYGAYLPTTMEILRSLLHSKGFWSQRGNPDSYIKVFGGPYVLGQKKGDQLLVRGSQHTNVTRILATAHNVMYTMLQLEVPAAPGFNTLIFGLNKRGSGFHYHRDQIEEKNDMTAKNAPLEPAQPVVTTVLYEKPQDSGKSLVLFKPLLNFHPSITGCAGNGDSMNDGSEYHAARCIVTEDGMMHCQAAGLQRETEHGVFATPKAESRVGFRVAITARITKLNAEEEVEAHLDEYTHTLGPEGNYTFPAT